MADCKLFSSPAFRVRFVGLYPLFVVNISPQAQLSQQKGTHYYAKNLMYNNPFISNNTNFIDESFFTATPSFVNGQNVFVSQEKKRKLVDSLNTSIMGSPFNNFDAPNKNMYIASNPSFPTGCLNGFLTGNYIQAEKHFVPPSGVLFSFSSPYIHSCGTFTTPHLCPENGMIYNPMHIPHSSCPTISRKSVFGQTIPSSMDYQQQFNGFNPNKYSLSDYQHQLSQNPFFLQAHQYPLYKVKFHFDSGTSCTDLQNGSSQGTADFQNLCGLKYQQDHAVLYQGHQPNTGVPSCFFNDSTQTTCEGSTNVKHLSICKPHTPPQGHVADILDNNTKKSVEFENPNPKENQINSCCGPTATNDKTEQTDFSYDELSCDKKKKGKKLSKKKKENNNNNYSTDDDGNSTKYNFFRKNKMKKSKGLTQNSERETTDTDSS